ncbi:lipopolysaccharide biosynthesis protein [Algibacter sp. PT7-4]|uniref:lipopolysaccharide biosynthesis protein n=1 Tax=Algibacter ulvanivorans TaxID=3400999 RepID=UPI003AACC9DA
MKKISKKEVSKLINLFLRVMPLAVKFVFFAALSKVLTTDNYGSYTLITTTVTVSIFVLGLDFYNYSIREVLINKSRVFQKLFSTFSLYAIIYLAISIIVAFVLLTFSNVFTLSPSTIIIITLICFSEHFCQEAYRLQIAFKKIYLANIIFFFRVFVWMAYLVIQVLLFQKEVSINRILNLWLIFNVVAVLLNFITAHNFIRKNLNYLKLDLDFIKKGLVISGLFFAGTLSLKSIEYLNRYIVDLFLGKEMTGIFSFYSNLALVISVYVNAIVISFELPALIEKGKSSQINSYFKGFKKSFLKHIIIIVVVLVIAIFPILKWQNMEIYSNYFYVFFILLLASAIMNYSLVFHFYLYIKKKDKKILMLTIKSGIFNLLATFALTYLLGILGASVSFLLTSICLFYLRKTSSKKIGYE